VRVNRRLPLLPSLSDIKRQSLRLVLSFVLALTYVERLVIAFVVATPRPGHLGTLRGFVGDPLGRQMIGLLLVSWPVMFIVLALERKHLRLLQLWAWLALRRRVRKIVLKAATYYRYAFVIIVAGAVWLLLAGSPLPALRTHAPEVGRGAFWAVAAALGLLFLIWLTRALRPPEGDHDLREKAYEWSAANVLLYVYVGAFGGALYWAGRGSPGRFEAALPEVAILSVITAFLVSGLSRWCEACTTVPERQRWLSFAFMWLAGLAVAIVALMFADGYENILSLGDDVLKRDWPNVWAIYPHDWQRNLMRTHSRWRDWGLVFLTIFMFSWSVVKTFGRPPARDTDYQI